MRIGEVAEVLGVSPDWIRRLEREGHLPTPRRDRNGQRRYNEEDLESVRRVIYARAEARSRHKACRQAEGPRGASGSEGTPGPAGAGMSGEGRR